MFLKSSVSLKQEIKYDRIIGFIRILYTVDYSWEYEYFDNEEQKWYKYNDGDAGRFHCTKKEIKKKVKDYIEKVELQGEQYRNLVVIINEQYVTTPSEI